MDNIAYLVNRQFILVAADTNFQVVHGDLELKSTNTQKVFLLNDRNLISVVGNPFKNSDVIRYIKRISELDTEIDFTTFLDDLKDVFNSSKFDLIDSLKEISETLPKFQNSGGDLNTYKLFEHFKDKPDYLSVLKEAISFMKNNEHPLTQIMLFGWDTKLQNTRIANFVSVGNSLVGNDYLEMLPDFVYTRFASRTVKTDVTQALEQKLTQQLSPLLTPGWDLDLKGITAMIESGKNMLREALKTINPYDTNPNVVFYELSMRTDFKFEIPKDKLYEITYIRGDAQ